MSDAESPGKHLFISYARADSAVIYPEIERLKSDGHPVWFDRGIRPGHEWTEEIAKALDEASHVVFFITPRSVASRNCRDELLYAQSHHIPVIAVHVEPTELSGGLKLSLGLSQAILKYDRTEAEYRAMLESAIGESEMPPVSAQITGGKSQKSGLPMAAVASIALVVVAIGAGLMFFAGSDDKVTAQPVAQQQAVAPEPEPAGPDIDRLSVAVLPFDDVSQTQDQRFFADGLADTLTQVLGSVQDLKVAARAASFTFRDSDLPVSAIAERLLVAHILNGSVQSSGSKVRVVAELVLAETGEQIWSNRFDGELDDIFAIQDLIANEVLEAMEGVLLTGPINETYRPNLEAYEQVILGRRRLETRTAESLKAAEDHFQKAIELDPNYALAYVSLADAYSLQDIFVFGYQDSYSAMPSNASRELQQPLLDKALALDPDSGEAHASLARITIDEDLAEQEFKKAIELAPNYAPAYLRYSDFLSVRRGRYTEALEMIEKARSLDPVSDPIKYAWIRAMWSVGRAEEAVTQLTNAVRSSPGFPPYYKLMARWQLKMGRSGNAMKWIRALREIDPDNPSHWGEFAGECHILREIGRDAEANDCSAAFIEAHPDSIVARREEARRQSGIEGVVDVLRQSQQAEPGNDYRVNQLANELVALGRFAEALEVLQRGHPELFTEQPTVTGHNIWPAMDTITAYSQMGEEEELQRLAAAVRDAIRGMRLILGPGYSWGIEEAQLASMLGDYAGAMDELEETFNEGWRFGTHFLPFMPQFFPLRENPRHIEILERAEAYQAAQNEWYEANKDQPLY